MIKVRFKIWECYVKFGRYHNNRIAITLLEIDTHEPVATATVNLPAEDLPEGYVYVKDYAENGGMYHALWNHKIIGGIEGIAFSGRVTIPMCKLLIPKEVYEQDNPEVPLDKRN